MVLGPSNAGKSTLALALSEKLGLPAVHLDRLQHLPNTDWQPRPESEFKALHDNAIMAEIWTPHLRNMAAHGVIGLIFLRGLILYHILFLNS